MKRAYFAVNAMKVRLLVYLTYIAPGIFLASEGILLVLVMNLPTGCQFLDIVCRAHYMPSGAAAFLLYTVAALVLLAMYFCMNPEHLATFEEVSELAGRMDLIAVENPELYQRFVDLFDRKGKWVLSAELEPFWDGTSHLTHDELFEYKP